MLAYECGWTVDDVMDLTKRQLRVFLKGRIEFVDAMSERRGSRTDSLRPEVPQTREELRPKNKDQLMALLTQAKGASIHHGKRRSRPGKRIKPKHLRGKQVSW